MGSSQPNPSPPRKTPLSRGLYILPSLFTVASLACGYYAILSTLRGGEMMASATPDVEAIRKLFDAAATFLGIAVVFDGLDGRIARLTNSASEFGREFDSLADVITFGVAPALLAFVWGVRPLEKIAGTQLVQHIQDAGWIISFAFLICGATRLARFNIQTTRPATDKRHFVGLPIPAGAGIIAAVVHYLKYPVNDWRYGLVWLIIVGLSAFLMVSHVRYPTFKTLDLRQPRSYLFIIALGLIIYLIVEFSEPVLLIIAFSYALWGPVARITSKLRPRPPAAREVHA